jgi:hypothetical protein
VFAKVGRSRDAWFMSKGEFVPEGHIVKYDFQGHELARFSSTNEFCSLFVPDVEPGASRSVYVTDADGRLLELNENLRLRRTVQITPRSKDWVELELHAITNLDEDPSPEFVFTSLQAEFVSGQSLGHPDSPPNLRSFHDNQVLVLKKDYQLFAKFLLGHRFEAKPELKVATVTDTESGKPDVLVLTDKVRLLGLPKR